MSQLCREYKLKIEDIPGTSLWLGIMRYDADFPLHKLFKVFMHVCLFLDREYLRENIYKTDKHICLQEMIMNRNRKRMSIAFHYILFAVI